MERGKVVHSERDTERGEDRVRHTCAYTYTQHPYTFTCIHLHRRMYSHTHEHNTNAHSIHTLKVEIITHTLHMCT